MNQNNCDEAGDDITGFSRGLPMAGFYGGWNLGLQPSAQQYPFFQGGWTAALNQGFMPPHAQNQPVVSTVESVQPVVMKESQGDGEGALVAAGRRRKVGPSRSKLSNFSPKEDVFLVKSWLEISYDPIINTGQKKEGFWARITSQYNNKRGSFPERSFRSLQSHWETIKAEASKFAGHMANTSLALSNFADIEEYPFIYMHCWDLLKDEPKWMELNIRGARPGDDDAIADHILTVDRDLETPSCQCSGSKRPMGRDATKRQAKKLASSSPTCPYKKISMWQEENAKKDFRYEQMAAIESQRYDEVRQHNQHMAAIEEEKLRIMRKKADILQTHEEERILGIDLDKCAPCLRMYYEKKQQEILKNIGADRDDSVDP
uniref:No apical meristem-associated C-terminal domain-containing protein n=1 Tax=Setaria italica TaxID=4555 RepID=K3XRH2_SETIT